jgi:3-dehydroquinate synthase
VLRSVEIKADIVGQDEREGGIRQILNFGHTLGHALELVSEYALPHGSAVARGMVLEARLGESLGITAPGTGDRLALVLAALGHEAGRPTQVERAHPPEAFVEATRLDKKARQGAVRYVLVAEPGRVARGTGPSGAEGWSHQVAPGPVVEVLSRARDGVGV